VEIPTNMPVKRLDEDDEVYRTAGEKYKAIVHEIEEAQKKGQPLLVGTTSIEKSEYLAEFLKKNGFRQIDFGNPDALDPVFSAARAGHASKHFAVLNARFHEQEAFIVAQAGVPGAITIATNMAGRGTDIQLGGNADMRIRQELGDPPEPGSEPVEGENQMDPAERARKEAAIREEVATFKGRVIAAGGLYILGTERHESRRIDNQLRGRAGRQGDPGRSKFYLSLQDDLMRIFGSDRMDGMLQRLGLKEDEAIVHPWINKAIEKAQGKVEARNFDMRKNILKYDNVMNDQRKVVFEQRREYMAQASVRETIDDMRHLAIEDVVERHIPADAYPEQWDVEGLATEVKQMLNVDEPVASWAKEEGIADEEIRERLFKAADASYAARVAKNSPEVMTFVEKQVLLQTLDHLWREHLVTLDHLRQVIGWRGYAQRDPLNEYKSEAFQLFNTLLDRLREHVTGQLMHVEVIEQAPEAAEVPPMRAHHFDPLTGEDELQLAALSAMPTPAGAKRQAADPRDPSTWGKVGRNDPCPCGSGKKYKHCHGRLA
jgi:preprotein translocase subunit SecA